MSHDSCSWFVTPRCPRLPILLKIPLKNTLLGSVWLLWAFTDSSLVFISNLHQSLLPISATATSKMGCRNRPILQLRGKTDCTCSGENSHCPLTVLLTLTAKGLKGPHPSNSRTAKQQKFVAVNLVWRSERCHSPLSSGPLTCIQKTLGA